MPSTTTRIAFIGGGNMARSLIAGLLADGYAAEGIRVSEPDTDKRSALARNHGIVPCDNAVDAAASAEVALLCVKPQSAASACRELGPALGEPPPLVVSVMAGVPEAAILGWLGRPVPLVRAMPNTPALLQAGAIGLHAHPGADGEQINLAEEVMRAAGLTRWVDSEAELDTVTAVSGSGPAYFFLLMEALEEAAITEGLDAQSARLLVIQTALGAARMAVESDESPQELRRRVTSPGGTTERGIAAYEDGGLRRLTHQAVAAARRRARELSELLAEEQ